MNVDKYLPMGFTLSCFYFEAFAYFLVVEQVSPGGGVLHYLDNFLFVGPAGSDLCDHFGIPLAGDKTVLPCQELEFLGISSDTVRMEFHLPWGKLVKSR